MWSGSTGLLEYQADQQTAKVSNFEDNFGIELLIRAAAEPRARALIRKEQPPGCRDLYVWPKRRIFEPSTCPSGHDDNNMWVIDKFEESCFHTTPSCFFLSSFTHHAHLARDVSLVFQITSPGKQPGITSRPQVTFAKPSSFSYVPVTPAWGGKHLTSKEVQAVFYSETSFARQSADTQGMSFFMRFYSRWNATRVQQACWMLRHQPRLRTPAPYFTWYLFSSKSSKPATHWSL